jgi:hypothetical protein
MARDVPLEVVMPRKLMLTLTLSVALCGSSLLSAQSRPAKADSVPSSFKPPAGMCRVWVEGVPASQQPASTDCASAVRNKPANAKVIYGEESAGGRKAPMPIKGFNKSADRKFPPLLPPDVSQVDPRQQKADFERKKISDEQLFGDRPAYSPASSYPGSAPVGASMSPAGPMGSYSGYVGPNGTSVGVGPITDPRFLNNNPNVRPPGYGSTVCLDRDGDGWCDDARFGPPTCLDKDKDGRCDDLAGFSSQAYPQTLPHMRSALDVIQGRSSTEVMTWLGTNEFQLRVPDQGRGGTPWRVIFLDQAGELLQVWTDVNRDGLADRVEIFKGGQRVKLLQR